MSIITTPAKARCVTNPYPVDSTTRTCCGGIGTHTRDCADIGPAPQPPAWCLPDATPDYGVATEQYGGGTLTTWERIIGDVWIACEDRVVDGRVIRSEPRIHCCEPSSDGIDQAAALRLARELVAAANILADA